MNETNLHSVAPRASSWRIRFLLLIVVIGAAFGIWRAYEYGQKKAGYNRKTTNEEIAKLQRKNIYLNELVIRLRGQLASMESGKKVDSQATTMVKQSLNSLQQQNQELREELQFYRSIISPSQGKPGVRIHKFKIDQRQKEDHFHYNLTLVHIHGLNNRQRHAGGVVRLTFEGEQNGNPLRLSFDKVSTPRKKEIRFKVKYFSRFEGDIVLPKSFRPRYVTVEVQPQSKGIEGDQQKIKWPNLDG